MSGLKIERFSKVPTFNIIELDNGHFAAQPNNRTLFYDKSLTPSEPKQPDFKVSTIEYNVESVSKWTAGDDTNYFYKFLEQKSFDFDLQHRIGSRKQQSNSRNWFE